MDMRIWRCLCIMLVMMCFNKAILAENLDLSYSEKVSPAVFTPKFEKQIMRTRFNSLMDGAHGGSYDVFLFAENEHEELEEHTFCDGITKKTPILTGNYYLYLFDLVAGEFVPQKIEVFKNTKMSMNLEGARFFPVYRYSKKKSDVLFVSQAGCGGNYYEAYSIPKKGQFLQQYVFVMNNKKYKRFFGEMVSNAFNEKDGVSVYGQYDDNSMKEMYLSLSDVPGELQLRPIESEGTPSL